MYTWRPNFVNYIMWSVLLLTIGRRYAFMSTCIYLNCGNLKTFNFLLYPFLYFPLYAFLYFQDFLQLNLYSFHNQLLICFKGRNRKRNRGEKKGNRSTKPDVVLQKGKKSFSYVLHYAGGSQIGLGRKMCASLSKRGWAQRLKVKSASTPRAFQDEEFFLVCGGPGQHWAGRPASRYHAQPCPYICVMTGSQFLTLKVSNVHSTYGKLDPETLLHCVTAMRFSWIRDLQPSLQHASLFPEPKCPIQLSSPPRLQSDS